MNGGGRECVWAGRASLSIVAPGLAQGGLDGRRSWAGRLCAARRPVLCAVDLCGVHGVAAVVCEQSYAPLGPGIAGDIRSQRPSGC